MLLGYLVDRILFVNIEKRIRHKWGFAPTT
jgi:hypothetical protein